MITRNHLLFLVLLGVSTSASACAPETSCLDQGHCRDGKDEANATEGDAGTAASAASIPMCATFGQPHIGLGGVDLAATADGPASGDRARAKPYSALITEYSRVLGSQNAPSLISTTGPTFGLPSDRWYLEPIASAVFVNTAFDVAFEGCLALTGSDAKLSAAPTKDTARAACVDWTRKFWSRDATPEQIDACVAGALDASITEHRWAYACASVLTSTGFLTF